MPENLAHKLTAEQRRTPARCDHPQREYLGSDNGAAFHRCLRCATVLISQDGRIWALPATLG